MGRSWDLVAGNWWRVFGISIVADAVVLSFVALTATLLFFDLRARRHAPVIASSRAGASGRAARPLRS